MGMSVVMSMGVLLCPPGALVKQIFCNAKALNPAFPSCKRLLFPPSADIMSHTHFFIGTVFSLFSYVKVRHAQPKVYFIARLCAEGCCYYK